MAVSCWRRNGDDSRALEEYKQVLTKFPNSREALRHIIAISKDLKQDYHQYESQMVQILRLYMTHLSIYDLVDCLGLTCILLL